MKRNTILIIDAHGRVGVELTRTLRKVHGDAKVVAADSSPAVEELFRTDPYERLECLEELAQEAVVTG